MQTTFSTKTFHSVDFQETLDPLRGRGYARYAAGIGVAVSLLLTSGCSEKSKIEKKAEWLCKQDLVKSPKLAGFPSDHPAENYIAEEDLSKLRAKTENAGAFAALAVGFTDVALGTQAAFAERTTCEVTVSMDDASDRATAKITQVRPDWSSSNPLQLLGELAELKSREKVQERMSELIDESNASPKTSEYDLTFVKEGDKWVALFDIEKLEKLEELDSEIARLQREQEKLAEALATATEAAQTLAKLEVSDASFSLGEDSIGMPRPIIKMTVKNNTGKAISEASFIGRLMSPGRSVPWLKEPFAYTIPGGLEPGEAATWQLAPNGFSAWGTVEAPEDAELLVTVVSVEGAAGDVIAELPRKPGSFTGERLDVAAVASEKEALDGKIAELEAKKDSL